MKKILLSTMLFSMLFVFSPRSWAEAVAWPDCSEHYFTCLGALYAWEDQAEHILTLAGSTWKDICNAEPDPAREECLVALGVITEKMTEAMASNPIYNFVTVHSVQFQPLVAAANANQLGLAPVPAAGPFLARAAATFAIVKDQLGWIDGKLAAMMSAQLAALAASQANPLLNPASTPPLLTLNSILTGIMTVSFPAYKTCVLNTLINIVNVAAGNWAAGGGPAGGGGGNNPPPPGGFKADILDSITYGILTPQLSPDTAPLNLDNAPYPSQRVELTSGNVQKVYGRFRLERSLPADAIIQDAVYSMSLPIQLIPAHTPICLAYGDVTGSAPIGYNQSLGCFQVSYVLDFNFRFASTPPNLWAICLEIGGERINPGESKGCDFTFDITGSPTELMNGAYITDVMTIRHVPYRDPESSTFNDQYFTSYANIFASKARPANACWIWSYSDNGYIWNTSSSSCNQLPPPH